MIQRELRTILEQYATEFRSVLLVGPRQSGKTTLVQEAFPDKPYVSLENPDERLLAETDARAFLSRFPEGAILDEVQRVPALFSYLQEILDKADRDGLFILTGSNNILLQENITQTLAGRLGILDLYPLSFREIEPIGMGDTLNALIFKGSYPEIYNKDRKPELWYSSYIRTYVERDVRQIKNIENTSLFIKFLKICAGRIGQQLNITAISNECGIDLKTVQSWLSVLEQTYVIKLLQPFYNNFNKRILKTPKLYFVDTGLACSLLGIRKTKELELSHFRGALVENYMIMECVKNNANQNTEQSFYYWRDNKGVEVDLIIDNGTKFLPVEIKSAETFSNDFTKNLDKIKSYSGVKEAMIVYNGKMEFETSDGISVLHWASFLKQDD
ncbi:ATP-binding protein [Parapedobacter sp. 10938]|uniref:ATP-binding protein n=1 Tax=Parapedobacter flavus TaxID=3110225 RepID=UPI002DBE31AB|nr:ATP-binding protein [Parapedobacter sp. 10938]MEC3880246.1 ATP-binding protein [Parapedobacter sp. 10938]